jgi:hypothetical protein
MTPEQIQYEESMVEPRVRYMQEIIYNMKPIVKTFLSESSGLEADPQNLMILKITERVYYNLAACQPLLDELFNSHHSAMPLSHIFRAIVYEIVVGLWLLDGDFSTRIKIINGDFIRSSHKLMKEIDTSFESNSLQDMFRNWAAVAGENFQSSSNQSGEIVLEIIPTPKFNFTETCKYLIPKIDDIEFLSKAYITLSQQAHISSFSREIIYNRYPSLIKMYLEICRKSIRASRVFIESINNQSSAAKSLDEFERTYFQVD